jgi:PIN domain nuclease of toxin-antitoxin system
MRYLLDTNAFIWWNGQSKKLSPRAFAICQDPSNVLLVSIASVWEMQIKLQLGKLTLPGSLAEIIEKQHLENQIELLPITLRHILAIGNLPNHHKDPFDRLLIAQTLIEGITLTDDPRIAEYPIPVVW